MEIQRVILNNVGLFEHLDIPLAPTDRHPSNITIFVGNNGAGKTSVVKASNFRFELLYCSFTR